MHENLGTKVHPDVAGALRLRWFILAGNLVHALGVDRGAGGGPKLSPSAPPALVYIAKAKKHRTVGMAVRGRVFVKSVLELSPLIRLWRSCSPCAQNNGCGLRFTALASAHVGSSTPSLTLSHTTLLATILTSLFK